MVVVHDTRICCAPTTLYSRLLFVWCSFCQSIPPSVCSAVNGTTKVIRYIEHVGTAMLWVFLPIVGPVPWRCSCYRDYAIITIRYTRTTRTSAALDRDVLSCYVCCSIDIIPSCYTYDTTRFLVLHVCSRWFHRDMVIEADCMQHMKTDVFPIHITKIDCKYFYKAVRVLVLPP